MRRKYYPHLAILIALFTAFMTEVKAQQLAFPSAEGFGKYTLGGRGGEVYHVTNLNDSGPGSFRDAVSQPYRIVVFDVGGVINISSRIVIKHHIYVAGQTAPGGGITIYGNGIAFNGDSGDDIIRYIRIRMGRNGDSGKDAVAISENQNYIFDNVSISWGRDGTLDVNGSGIDNLTFQDCIVSQGINNQNHSTGGLMQSGKWSIIRSLYHSNKTRNPKARGTQEFINSVLYNWATNGYIMGDTEGLSECNMIGNHFIYGPSSNSGAHITNTTPSFHVYGRDNWIDDNKNGVLDAYQMTNYKTATVVNTPYNYPGVNTLLSASDALTYVLDNVGASLVRDEVDELLINQVKSYGTQGRIINYEDDNGISGNVGYVANGTPPTDTDQDGMPDEWEIERGLNPNVADDKGDDDGDGYTNIEEYLSCIVGEGDACDFNPILDCAGVQNGTAYLDECGECVGGNTGKTACYIDCAGVVDGNATIDECGECVGGNTGTVACAGAIQGEDFCEAIGVHEAKNLGYTGGGYLNFDNQVASTGEWNIYAAEAGTYKIGFRYANGGGASRSMSIQLNGNNVGTFTGAVTGAWTTWQTEDIYLNLSAGVNNVILSATTADGGPNLDLLAFDDENLSAGGCVEDCNGVFGGTAFMDECGTCVGGNTGGVACVQDCYGDWGGTATIDACGVCSGGNTGMTACTSSIQAEEACVIEGTVDSDNLGYTGEGFVNTTNQAGANILLSVHAEATISTTVSFVYANGGTTDRPATIIVNGNTLGTLTLSPTTDWEVWEDEDIILPLVQGNNRIELIATSESGIANIDQLKFYTDGISLGSCGVDCHGDVGGNATTDACGKCVGGNTGAISDDADADGILDCEDNYPNDYDNDGVVTTSDCDDNNATVGAAVTWYLDADGDGVGVVETTQESCAKPTSYVAISGDLCPNDINKTQPGECGCGVTEESCLDCMGTPNGDAYYDNCNECVGGNPGQVPCTQDCNNDWGGTATTDACGTCAGGKTGVEPVSDPQNCIATGLEDLNGNEAVLVYPNPSLSEFNVKATGRFSYMVYTISGVLVEQGEGKDKTIIGGELTSGTYLLEIKEVDGYQTRLKIVKQ